MLNHIVIMGRLVRDPEYRATGNGTSCCNFTVAVDRDFSNDGKKETDFIDCVAWRKTAEFVTKYFQKGSMIVLSGRLQIRNWNDKEGNKRRSAEIVADNCYFGSTKKESEGSPGGYGQYGGTGYPEADAALQRYGAYPKNDFVAIEDDDAQLPFL